MSLIVQTAAIMACALLLKSVYAALVTAMGEDLPASQFVTKNVSMANVLHLMSVCAMMGLSSPTSPNSYASLTAQLLVLALIAQHHMSALVLKDMKR